MSVEQKIGTWQNRYPLQLMFENDAMEVTQNIFADYQKLLLRQFQYRNRDQQ